MCSTPADYLAAVAAAVAVLGRLGAVPRPLVAAPAQQVLLTVLLAVREVPCNVQRLPGRLIWRLHGNRGMVRTCFQAERAQMMKLPVSGAQLHGHESAGAYTPVCRHAYAHSACTLLHSTVCGHPAAHLEGGQQQVVGWQCGRRSVLLLVVLARELEAGLAAHRLGLPDGGPPWRLQVAWLQAVLHPSLTFDPGSPQVGLLTGTNPRCKHTFGLPQARGSSSYLEPLGSRAVGTT